MCGIGGALGVADPVGVVVPMLARLTHRGPDDKGCVAIDLDGHPVGAFVHRRLSIIDLSPAGHQPMCSSDGRFTITYNGEIYNYRELRTALNGSGVRFRSGSDTEVLLEGYAAWGIDLIRRIRGMYAFALWDNRERELVLARDPFGIKPLYYAFDRGRLIFASEIRALLASGMISRNLSRSGIAAYLSYGCVSEPETILADVVASPPGTLVKFAFANGTVSPPASHNVMSLLELASEHQQTDAAECSRRVRERLRESVAAHMVSDVPVAFFLSGGIDSSALVGLAAEVSKTPLHTFTIRFAESEFDEGKIAGLVARRFKTDHCEVPLSATDLIHALPDFFKAIDQPTIDGVNTFLVSRAVRQHGYRVVISGLGADELFAGYSSFARAAVVSKMWPIIARLKWAGRALALSPRNSLQRLVDGLAEHSAAAAVWKASRSLFSSRQVRALLGVNARPLGKYAQGRPTLAQVSLYEATGYMRDMLLRDTDVFSMAHSLEVRVPYVDWQIATVALSAPDNFKLRHHRPKPLLLDAIEYLLPHEVWQRRKQGFTFPFASWMKSELSSSIDAELAPERFDRIGIDPRKGRRVWMLFNKGQLSWSRAWSLYVLSRWAGENDLAVD
jgi:asparagine synthase (glutamine-hydrolysing)